MPDAVEMTITRADGTVFRELFLVGTGNAMASGRSMRDDRHGERGAALLTVLLLVAIVGALAAATMEKLNLSTRQAANAKAMEQARGWSQAASIMALVRIEAVLGQDRSRVSLAGGWSDRPFALPVPDGVATARVHDGGNCFNLNSLVVQVGAGTYAARTARHPAIRPADAADRRDRRRFDCGGERRLDRQRQRAGHRRRRGRSV